jgi:hypothetical protein
MVFYYKAVYNREIFMLFTEINEKRWDEAIVIWQRIVMRIFIKKIIKIALSILSCIYRKYTWFYNPNLLKFTILH